MNILLPYRIFLSSLMLCFSSPVRNNVVPTVGALYIPPPGAHNLQPPPPPDPRVKPNQTWTTISTAHRSYSDGSSIWPVCNDTSLKDGPTLKAPSFGCGIYRNIGPTNSFLFAVFANPYDASKGSPLVLWSANRNRPVQDHASVQFTEDGDLQLTDVDGTVVWSTNTSGESMGVTDMGNLIIYGKNAGMKLWQSFECTPSDVILPDQSLTGKKIFSNVSRTNSSTGDYYLQIESDSFEAYVLPYNQTYYRSDQDLFFSMRNGVILPFKDDIYQRRRMFMSFWRLEQDGHLRSYEWTNSNEGWDWTLKREELIIQDCSYPSVCGSYSLCTGGQCSCLQENDNYTKYFRPRNINNPKEGCVEKTPLSCPPSPSKNHSFLQFDGYSFYGYNNNPEYGRSFDSANCKKACSENCSCKGAFFKYDENRGDGIGRCYLSSTVLFLYDITNTIGYNSSSFIKVHVLSSSGRRRSGNSKKIIIGSMIGPFLFILVCFAMWATVKVKKKRRRRREKELYGKEEEEVLAFNHIHGGPRRFSYNDLTFATNNFSHKLGEGGSGAVFEGELVDGTKVAVKMLGQKEQGKKEFLAEVETIGNIHHLNLVRLIGYCYERFHRLLVYELMSNGSLEKWIFPPTSYILDWKTRFNIMHDVAKGLSYLHEECRHRIIHLDIKPQNILLDSSFNAKVSDFGLSKLIDRDQSQVFTTMRGTPGYLAPEWLNSAITEKVDVYSFGVVLLEVMCGMRSLDCKLRSPESAHLINVVKMAMEEKRLLQIIDQRINENEGYYTEERLMKMFRLAVRCLHSDYNKRPSMSEVVKVLDGSIEPTSTDNFYNPDMSVGGSGSSNLTTASTVSEQDKGIDFTTGK